MSIGTAAGLTEEQLVHFAEHGWVLLERVLTEERCQAYIAAIDRVVERHHTVAQEDSFDTTRIENILIFDGIFLEWFKLPGIVEANRQLLGARPRHEGASAHIKVPHPERHARADELIDPDSLWWHRGLRPRWGTLSHETDARLVNCAYLLNVTYLTPVSHGNGSTAILDGSHRFEGRYEDLKRDCQIVQPEAPAGSIVIFTESLVHAAVPIASEITRYNMYYGFVLPWFASWPGFEVPQALVDSLKDDELRDLLAPPYYKRGQYPDT